MLLNFKHTVLALGLSVLAASCGVEEFATKKNKDGINTNPITIGTQNSCSQFTYIKPKVDFLFLWDNSSSAVFINPQTRQALMQTIDFISDKFDYHIALAPLVPNNTSFNHVKFLISDTPSGQLSSDLSGNILDDRAQANAHLSSFPTNVGNSEYGTQRAIDVINHFKTQPNQFNNYGEPIYNGFRPNAHTIIVLMSTEDDDGKPVRPDLYNSYINQKVAELNTIKNSLDSEQLRFFSIVRKKSGGGCSGYSDPYFMNEIYKKISNANFYQQNPLPELNDLNTNVSARMQDSFDLCAVSDFTRIFDGINNSITDVVLGHKYDHWPVALPGANIDENEVYVSKNGASIPRSYDGTAPSGASGWFTYTNSVQTVNTRYEPEPGEPFTGYVVELFGSARVTYPECVSVRTQTPLEWYGYAHMSAKPIESSIQLKIDGIAVSKCGSTPGNCWELLKNGSGPTYISNQNLRITAPNNFTPKTPGVIKSGYFLKLHGNAAYSNGQSVNVIYDPSGS